MKFNFQEMNSSDILHNIEFNSEPAINFLGLLMWLKPSCLFIVHVKIILIKNTRFYQFDTQ